MISTELDDFRFVAVGNRMFCGKNWRFFTDFLLYHMKEVLGRGWGQRALRSGTQHPVLVWLRKMNELRDAQGNTSDIVESRGEGFVTALFRFAYALYLIAHHDVVPTSLLRRLRQSSEFRPAAVETMAVAAFAVAGYQIEMGEDRKGRGPEGEFRATSAKTGKTFSVEAKRKNGWKAPIDLSNEQFQTELRLWVQRKIYAAAKKQLDNPVYWLELSIAQAMERSQVEQLQTLVRDALRQTETEIRINGCAPGPAYVFVTNHAFLADDDAGDMTFVMLEGFHIHMHVAGEQVELEEALDERDRDRDAIWILKCLQQVQVVPHHFDGTPDALVDETKAPIKRLQVGQRLEVALPEHSDVKGIVTEVVSKGSDAMVVLADEQTGKQQIVSLPLTREEQKAAAELGDLVFGNPTGRRIPDDDPLAVYDFFLQAYSDTPREKLLEFLAQHPQRDQFTNLGTDLLRTRLCREWTKSVIADQQTRAAKAVPRAA